MRFLSKKIVLLSVPSFLGTLFLFHTFVVFVWCPVNTWFTYTQCYIDRDFTSLIFTIGFVVTIAIVPFSLLTLPLAPSIFKAWKSFAVWAVPAMLAITALLILGGEGNAYFSFGFGPFILMILYGLYFLVSLVIIIIAAVKARKKQM